jgi:GT2 family glycosyltransferase/glycosyltransferase involved in cell wall biosynthesis
MSDATAIERLVGLIFDPHWYRVRYPDVSGDPLRHFIDHGLEEGRDPCRWFDSAWYKQRHAGVAASGILPLLHYLTAGIALGLDPHPRFNAAWYVAQHPEAANNPLLFHLRTGTAQGWLTEPRVAIADYLPARPSRVMVPEAVAVDVIIPVYRDLELTGRCIRSVLDDPERPPGRVIVIDDVSPEPALRAWLKTLAAGGAIQLIRNRANLGFVASVNRGMVAAGDHDVVLLNSDTEVPAGWLRRLQAQAYAGERVASLSPLSNNAVICSWLGFEGAPIPPDLSLAALDDACRAANAGRWAAAPTTVGFCMYIRRAALDAVGLFDAETFGKGYGEENDFCLRASAQGWEHRIACDVFVRHEGSVSFGAESQERIAAAMAILTARYPDYTRQVEAHVLARETEPARFAATMALFRDSGLPVILMVAHGLGGGVYRYLMDTVERDRGRVHYLLLEPDPRGVALSVPAYPGHPVPRLAAERWTDIAAIARSAGVSRVQIHQLMGLDLDLRALSHDLRVPFDVMVHDWFALCPHVTMLPTPAAQHCGEPGPDGCDACIAHLPPHGATDILSWRLRAAWTFHEAARVFAPSRDALNRLARFGLAEKAVFAPHEPVAAGPWPIRRPGRAGKRLRVAILGTLANHKGAQLAAALAGAPGLHILLIGALDAAIPEAALSRMTITGAYEDAALAGLIEAHRPDVIWFPAAWPETYSYTLSAAIESGLPIAASAIGAFPERLAGRPLTWLVPPSADPAVWLDCFREVAAASRARTVVTAPERAAVPAVAMPVTGRRTPALVDVRRRGGRSVVVIPETFADGSFTPCAQIRLLRPLDHPVTGAGMRVTLADAASARDYRADLFLTQRHAIPSIAAADALADHAAKGGAALVFDLDDDLIDIPDAHPEAAMLRPKAAVVAHMVRRADVVRVSTPALAARVAPVARRVAIVPNALDERIWRPRGPAPRDLARPVRLLCMGTATHDADFAMIRPALEEIHRAFAGHVELDLIGFVASGDVPPWVRRITPPVHASRSYPGFVSWLTRAGPWDVGLAPLEDSPFNACKSAIKALDFAALGMATIASAVPAYRGSLAEEGALVPNTTGAWFDAISRAIRDPGWREARAAAAVARLRAEGILAARDTKKRPDF